MNESHTGEFANDFPFLIYEMATELSRHRRHSLAVGYYELLRAMPGGPDPATLLQLGRCRLSLGEQPAAEECFLAAIDADEGSIEARVELANMYEKAKEDEEALILAAEAMALQEARGQTERIVPNVDDPPESTQHRKSARRKKLPRKLRVKSKGKAALSGDLPKLPVIPRRYRPKRLAGLDRRLQDEESRAHKLSRQYEAIRDQKRQILSGRKDLIPDWAAASKELVDDFRSLKGFYSWDKYLRFLGSRGLSHHPSTTELQGSELSQMYDRLARGKPSSVDTTRGIRELPAKEHAAIAPHGESRGLELGLPGLMSHWGISIEDWLDLFLDYAIGMAIAHRREEAYRICQAAKDSIVFHTAEHKFSIYVAWSG